MKLTPRVQSLYITVCALGFIQCQPATPSTSNALIESSSSKTYSPENQQIRARIASAAKSHLGSTFWDYEVKRKNFPANSHKCNLFVAEVVSSAAQFPYHQVNGQATPWPLLAGEWGDASLKIEGWEVIPEKDARPGDVAAYAYPFADATSHVVIVSSDVILDPTTRKLKYNTIGTVPGQSKIQELTNQEVLDPHNLKSMVVRRYVNSK